MNLNPSPEVVAAFRVPETGSGKVVGKPEIGNILATDPVPIGTSILGWTADGRIVLLIPFSDGAGAVAMTKTEARAVSANLLKMAEGYGRDVVPHLAALVPAR